MKHYIIISWLAAAGLCLPSQENTTTTTTSPGRAVRSAERGCPAHCRLPACSCGITVPGGLSPDTVPQFVLLTFDDAVNELNREFYSRLFDGRTNPDGCPVAATMFVSHEWTDYAQVEDLYQAGHEIASHTVTHSHPAGYTADRWAREIGGQADLLSTLGRIPRAQITGVRAPFLQTGGDAMYSVLAGAGLQYDSSIPSPRTSPALWPYTLDRELPHRCPLPPCPARPHPGIWEIPMTLMDDGMGGHGCPMLDACRYEEDTESIRRMLTRNFLRHYTDNKAPFPMFYHAAWFRLRPHREEALVKFMDDVLELPDVYFVTAQQLLDWVRSPRPAAAFSQTRTVNCPPRPARPCTRKQKCSFSGKTFSTCADCPAEYPWI